MPPPGRGIDALKQQPLQLAGEQPPLACCMHPPAKHVSPLGHVVQASPFEPHGSVGAVGTKHLSPKQQPLGQLAKLQDPEPLDPPELLEPLAPLEAPELLEPPEPPEPLAPLEAPELLEPPEPPEPLAPLETPGDPEGRSSKSDDREQPRPDATLRVTARTKEAIRTSP
jgi:hypothetical protein